MKKISALRQAGAYDIILHGECDSGNLLTLPLKVVRWGTSSDAEVDDFLDAIVTALNGANGNR